MQTLSFYGLVHSPDAVVSTFLHQIYPAMASAISPVISVLAILYWVVFGYQIYAGYQAVVWRDVLQKSVMTVMVFSVLHWAGLASMVYHVFIDVMTKTVDIVMVDGANTEVMFDKLWRSVADVAAYLMHFEGSEIGLTLQGFGLFILNCTLFAVVVAYLVVAKLGLAVTMVLLPLFVGFFFFAFTKQWAVNWCSAMVQFCLLFIVVHAVLRLGCLVYAGAIDDIHFASEALLLKKINVTSTAYIYIIESILLYIILHIRRWVDMLSQQVAVHSASLASYGVKVLHGGRI